MCSMPLVCFIHIRDCYSYLLNLKGTSQSQSNWIPARILRSKFLPLGLMYHHWRETAWQYKSCLSKTDRQPTFLWKHGKTLDLCGSFSKHLKGTHWDGPGVGSSRSPRILQRWPPTSQPSPPPGRAWKHMNRRVYICMYTVKTFFMQYCVLHRINWKFYAVEI